MEETIGRNTAVDKSPSELEHIFALLDKQKVLLMDLHEKLNSVSHRPPSEPSKAENGLKSPHISSIVDIIGDNNQKVRDLISQLAI